MFVMNLATAETKEYDDNTDPFYALADTYCQHDEELYKRFLKCCNTDQFDRLYKALPFKQGIRTIACGDWCLLKPDYRGVS